MKGAKRILSVFLLVMMLCTFFAFPAEAATNYWPSLSSWNLGSDNISLISGGTAFDLAGSNPSNKGVAMGSVSLPAGKSYRLTGKFSFARRGTTASAIFSFLPANGDEIIIWQGAVGVTDINIDKVINLRSDQVGGAFFVYIETGGVVTLSNFQLVDNSTDTGILNSIKEGFSKLWEWLQNIWNTIKEIPTKIGQFITNLGDRISTFFSNLTNSIKGFFNDLWDKIWNGDGSVPPFDNNNKFAQVIEKLNEWTAKIKEFSGSVDSSADTVTGYLQSGTSFLNSAMGAFPAALTAVLGFALVFIVVRKVVGR